jgi:hypothetical protein
MEALFYRILAPPTISPSPVGTDKIPGIRVWGEFMSTGKARLLESGLVLALLGILAGAIGGLAVGLVTAPKTTSSSSASH